MKQYEFSEAWWDDLERAQRAFTVTHWEDGEAVRYAAAEANTGSRYSVAVSRLPYAGELIEGGSQLVSVLAPWRTAYPLAGGGNLHWEYVLEKFVPRLTPHAGDLAALVLLIGVATERQPVLPLRCEEEVARG